MNTITRLLKQAVKEGSLRWQDGKRIISVELPTEWFDQALEALAETDLKPIRDKAIRDEMFKMQAESRQSVIEAEQDLSELPVNHDEAFELAHLKKHESNLARCYLNLVETEDHDSLRDKIGQALSDAVGNDPSEIDWFDSRQVDHVADAVIAVLSKRKP